MSLSFARATPGATRIGWIGAGVMGCSMAGHLIDAGYPLTVFNRTAAKCDPLVAKGAQLATTPAEVASASDVVFSIVGYPQDVRNVILGPDGALGSLREGGILVDMTTSEPSLAMEISEAATARGVGSLDAPVSGGDVGAREAKLAIMVGGEQGAFDAVLPLFELMGQNIKLMGPAGAGQHTKMCNQIMIATNMIGVVEGLLYAYRAGLDMEDVIAAIGSGAAGSFSLNVLGPRMAKRNFDPGFFVEHFIKDMGIALAEAKRLKLSLPGLALAHQLYVAMEAQGHGRKGTQGLILALEKLNGMERPE